MEVATSNGAVSTGPASYGAVGAGPKPEDSPVEGTPTAPPSTQEVRKFYRLAALWREKLRAVQNDCEHLPEGMAGQVREAAGLCKQLRGLTSHVTSTGTSSQVGSKLHLQSGSNEHREA